MFYQLKPFIGSPTQIQQKLENLIPAGVKVPLEDKDQMYFRWHMYK